MAKFYGKIGFGSEQEVSPGVYDYVIVERPYSGEVVRDALNVVGGQTVLGESKTANTFNIMSDGYALTNYFDMEYVHWMGKNWKVTQVEIRQHPRIHVRIGGVWNGPVAATPTP